MVKRRVTVGDDVFFVAGIRRAACSSRKRRVVMNNDNKLLYVK